MCVCSLCLSVAVSPSLSVSFSVSPSLSVLSLFSFCLSVCLSPSPCAPHPLSSICIKRFFFVLFFALTPLPHIHTRARARTHTHTQTHTDTHTHIRTPFRSVGTSLVLCLTLFCFLSVCLTVLPSPPVFLYLSLSSLVSFSSSPFLCSS